MQVFGYVLKLKLTISCSYNPRQVNVKLNIFDIFNGNTPLNNVAICIEEV